MKVSAVVVTYNRLKLLKECLFNLFNQYYELNNIFVINNNSTDGTKDYLNNINNKKVIPVNLKKNLGGAGGFSLGTKIAYEKSDSDYFWLMDDDTMPTSNSLYSLIKATNKLKNNFGFLCSNVRWWKDYHAVNLPEVSSEDWSELLPSRNLIKVNNATFVSFLVRRTVVKKVGLPIADMFIWGDDYEYSTRICKYFPSYFVLDSLIIHKSKQSNGNETIYNTTRMKNYNYLYRNYLFIAKKYYGLKKIIKQILVGISEFIKALFVSNNKKVQRSFCILSGIIKGIFFNPKVKFPDKRN